MNVAAALMHLLIPQESNNHRARVLHLPVLLAILVIFVISQNGVKVVRQEVLGYASQISTTEVIRLSNIKRAENGVGALTENPDLDRAAKAKGMDMLAKGYWAHVSPDGTQPWDFFKSVGYKYRYAGENLARDFSNPASAVDAWMASPSHKENLLSNRYKEIGVAVVDGSLNGKDATIIVQLFGTTVAGVPQIPIAAAKEASTSASVSSEVPMDNKTISTSARTVEVVSPNSLNINYSQLLSFGMIGFILMALALDAGVLWYRGIKRPYAGKSLAQIAFFSLILGLIVIIKVGQIL